MRDGDIDLQRVQDESLSVSHCSVKAPARHVSHVVDLCESLGGVGWVGGNIDGLPLLSNLAGDFVSKESVAGTIDAAATGLGLPITYPDGHRLYGGHYMRV